MAYFKDICVKFNNVDLLQNKLCHIENVLFVNSPVSKVLSCKITCYDFNSIYIWQVLPPLI